MVVSQRAIGSGSRKAHKLTNDGVPIFRYMAHHPFNNLERNLGDLDLYQAFRDPHRLRLASVPSGLLRIARHELVGKVLQGGFAIDVVDSPYAVELLVRPARVGRLRS